MRTLLLALPALALAACGAADAGGSRQVAAGPRITRSYPLSGFTGVAASGSEDVDVRAGPFAVRAEGPQAVLDRLDIRVENGTLKIGHKPGSWSWSGDTRTKISVSLPAIDAAILAGSGNMTVDRAAGTRFEGSISGSGNLTLAAVTAQRLELNLAGSGNVVAKGRASRADYSVAGSGDIDARDLQADALALSIAGSGNIDARAKTPVKVSIVGSGDVTVTGAPCTVTKVGSGDAKCS